MAAYVLRYEAETGASISSYAIMIRGIDGATWIPFNLKEEKMNMSSTSSLNDSHASEAVRQALNLTSDDAQKFVSVSVTTLKLSKNQRQIARIEIQDSPEARAWLRAFGGDAQSPQRMIVDKLGDIAKLNSADDIEIILTALSAAQPESPGKVYQYLKTFYLAQLDWQLITNDPLYIPSGPPSGPPTVMPTVLPHMISPLPTPATP